MRVLTLDYGLLPLPISQKTLDEISAEGLEVSYAFIGKNGVVSMKIVPQRGAIIEIARSPFDSDPHAVHPVHARYYYAPESDSLTPLPLEDDQVHSVAARLLNGG